MTSAASTTARRGPVPRLGRISRIVLRLTPRVRLVDPPVRNVAMTFDAYLGRPPTVHGGEAPVRFSRTV